MRLFSSMPYHSIVDGVQYLGWVFFAERMDLALQVDMTLMRQCCLEVGAHLC